MQTNEAQEISATALVSDSPQPFPAKKPRVPWPKDFPIRETYPGSKIARHPVTKAFVKLSDAIADGGKPEGTAAATEPATATTAKPVEIKAEEKPETTIQPTAEATATATGTPAGEPRPQPTAQAEEKPDFSNVNGGGPNSQGEQPGETKTTAEALGSHETMGAMFHGVIENILCMIFGEGFRARDDEKSQIIKAWVRCLEFWNARILNPVEQLAAAYGCYVFGRITIIVAWFKQWRLNRKIKKAGEKIVREHMRAEPKNAAEPDKKAPEKTEIRADGASLF